MTPYSIYRTYSGTDSAAPSTSGVAVSGTDVYYSKMWGGENAAAYDLQVVFTGTPTGTLILQVSDKPNPVETTDTDWVTSTEITLTDPAGSGINNRYSSVASPAYRRRLKYTNASGSGTLVAYARIVKS